MIASVVFCPQAPVLVPDLAQGAAVELAELRAACRAAIRRAVAAQVRPVLVGAGGEAAQYGERAWGTLAGFGLQLDVSLDGRLATPAEPAAGPAELPPALTVGAWLLRDALGPAHGARAVAVPDEGGELPDLGNRDVALIVLGDGSARRAEKGPGYLDERAEAFDASVAEAMRTGTASRLRRSWLAGHGAEELLVSGLAAWDAVAAPLESMRWTSELLFADAPYGVGYFVAAWQRRE